VTGSGGGEAVRVIKGEGNLINNLAEGLYVEGDALVLEVGVVVGWGGGGKGG
jgi:hypothetical protein